MSDDIFKLVIGSDEFKFWDSVSLTRNFDTFDTFAFSAPYGKESLLRKIIKPLEFKEGKLYIDEQLISTITMVDVNPNLDNPINVDVSGYAAPGVLNDCNIENVNLPIQYDGQTLQQIADTICGYFGLKTFFSGKSGAPFEKVKVEPDEKPFDFLIKLAKQRGFLISSTALGKMLFRKASTNPKSTTLKQGHTPLLSVTPNISPQQYYSEITGLGAGSILKDPETVTIKNPFLSGVKRPFTFKVKNGLTGADLQNAVKWKMGTMFGTAIQYTATVQGLRDERGRIWETNTAIDLTAPGAYIDNETRFLIKNLSFDRTSTITTMNLVLPESYTGEIPKRLPWD